METCPLTCNCVWHACTRHVELAHYVTVQHTFVSCDMITWPLNEYCRVHCILHSSISSIVRITLYHYETWEWLHLRNARRSYPRQQPVPLQWLDSEYHLCMNPAAIYRTKYQTIVYLHLIQQTIYGYRNSLQVLKHVTYNIIGPGLQVETKPPEAESTSQVGLQSIFAGFASYIG